VVLDCYLYLTRVLDWVYNIFQAFTL
jgi:hypothetical protein